ncbi:flavin reductase family protein [Actinospica durhamensis]|uniref:Flavin reductase family protein n=1 Tax=Actinospica durhamensis TaxID=1508375 RepID=A0A941EKA2_9ACTN|nr:flavin reductase family protein [Actinospica durhamensis]MBR7831903.1 flavin reductase family protein [Actinospica durhamensis]
MDAKAFTAAMARVPGAVTVVTTVDGAGRRWGFTSSSFCSVSLDPPLVLVCLGKKASTHPAFAAARHFMVNVLTEDQALVAQRFATSGIDRFAAGDMQACELGLPGLPAPCARVACAARSLVDAGDHSILIGEVEAVHVGPHTPLVYVDRAYTCPLSVGDGAVLAGVTARPK